MRLAFVSDSAYPWFNGGIEKRRFIIMRRLASEGNEVHCFTMHRESMPGRNFSYNGIRYHSVGEALGWQGMYRGGSKRRSIRMPLIFSALIFFKIFQYRFDALDADSFPFLHLVPLYVYTRIRGVRFAISWHEVWNRRFWSRYLRGVGVLGYFVEWLCARIADVHIANASTTANLLVSELGVPREKIVVFPVAVDSKEIRDFASRRKAYRKKRQFIVVSRLVKHKRVGLAIAAVAKTSARLVIVGSGPDLAGLRELAGEKAPGRVTFKHDLSTGQLFAEMLESQAMLMLSEREGLSLATLEALALGVPVVVANTTSLPSEVKHMCFETRESGLTSLLNKMLADSRKYSELAKRQRGRVLAEFSGDNARAIYEKVVRG